MTEPELEILVDRYVVRGQSLAVIAGDFGCDKSTLSRALRRCGVVVRPRGGAPPTVFAEERFGRLTVECEAGRTPTGQRTYRCQCDCGGTWTGSGNDLRKGHVRSCGCLHRESSRERMQGQRFRVTHGLSGHPVYRVWRQIQQRTSNPNCPDYPNYGGRGIRPCVRWTGPKGFENFMADMGSRPEGAHVHRIDHDGDYDPSNCRWLGASDHAALHNISRAGSLVAKATTP